MLNDNPNNSGNASSKTGNTEEPKISQPGESFGISTHTLIEASERLNNATNQNGLKILLENKEKICQLLKAGTSLEEIVTLLEAGKSWEEVITLLEARTPLE
jgi:hypothetical protein